MQSRPLPGAVAAPTATPQTPDGEAEKIGSNHGLRVVVPWRPLNLLRCHQYSTGTTTTRVAVRPPRRQQQQLKGRPLMQVQLPQGQQPLVVLLLVHGSLDFHTPPTAAEPMRRHQSARWLD